MRSAIISLVVSVLGCSGCAGEPRNVLSAHDAGGGQVRVFDANVDQAWQAARAALTWNHAATIEEHRPEGYMLGIAGASGWSWGATMGVWIEPADPGRTGVRVIVSRKLATNVTAQSERGLLDDIAKAIALEMRGLPLPDREPE